MTVTYSGDVGNASIFGCFNAILLKWRGSVYKLIYKELCAYIVVYFLINLIYRWSINGYLGQLEHQLLFTELFLFLAANAPHTGLNWSSP